MRLAYYAGASTAAAAACLLKAFHQRPNFYSAAVYLSQSNACLLILTNLLLVLACTFMYGLQRLLYGPLRPIEIEQLSEKAWYAVLDTLLAMPSFREDVGGWLLAMFTLLLAGKVWGWIGEGRVDVLEQQPPANPRLFHLRLATSLCASVAFDIYMLNYCIETVMADPRPGMMVIFTFEFAILTVFSTFTLSRYALAVIQARVERVQMEKAMDERKAEICAERAAARQNETANGTPTPASPPSEEPIEVDENELDVPGWEEKRRYLFALEVFTDFIKLLIYIVFFTVSITFNGLPMHIMRDVYMTFASFSKRVSDYVTYRKATSDMNARYPDATTEEIRGDACIVCREIMVAWEEPGQQRQQHAQVGAPAPAPARRRDEGLRAKKLPCGHILHVRCLKSWLERQQVCPTCRRPVVTAPDPAARGQAGAAGAAQGAQVQQGRQQQQQPQQPRRQGRARIFNLGPVRIGFLNGPGDQIQNIVRQMQNGNQQQPRGANQQGPNHLGLQVPYANGAGQNGGGNETGVQAVTTQMELQDLENRIMTEARRVTSEQDQLTVLRGMQNELERLRSGGVIGLPELQMYGQQAMWPQMPTTIQTIQGSTTQMYGSGHEHLPQGMVLPEGWTVMPLTRNQAHGPALGGPLNMPATFHGPAVIPVDAATTVRSPVPTAETPDQAPATMNASESNNTNGPTDEQGSPYFVPRSQGPPEGSQPHTTAQSSVTDIPPISGTAPQVSDVENGAPAAIPGANTDSTEAEFTPTPGESGNSHLIQRLTSNGSDSYGRASHEDVQQAPPWTSSNGWGFDNPATSTSPNGQSAETSGMNGEHTTHPAVPSIEAEAAPSVSYEGKGKAKAAQVEDADDDGV